MLNAEAKNWLQATFQDVVRFDEPLGQHTTLRIGGPAEALVAPGSVAQLSDLIQWCRRGRIPYTVIGGGSNLLVADAGVRGVTIGLSRLTDPLEWVQAKDRIRITAAAGLPTRRLCGIALRQEWQGLNFALGIPGQLGGAIWMNAGGTAGQMADIIAAVTLVNNAGQVVRLDKQALTFEYRRLVLPAELVPADQHGPILVQAELELTVGEGAVLRNQAREILRARARTQPIGSSSAGCFFKNPSPREPAGRLIEAAGLKGAAVGDAQVSMEHANFIINRGRATAGDVLALKALIEETVWRRFSIRLQPEVRIVGQTQDA